MLQQPPVQQRAPPHQPPSSSSSAVLRVLRHPALLRLWIAQVIYLSAQSTASYALIIQMTNATHSATLVGLVLIALILPPFLLSAPAGALVDRLERRRVLWVSNVLRALAAALFVLVFLAIPHVPIALYPLALIFALVGLAFTPAEGALIPTLVDADEMLPAFSLYNLTINVTQVLGLLVIGPLLFNMLPTFRIPVSADAALTLTPVVMLFAGVALLYLLAAALVYRLPREGQIRRHSLDASLALKAEHDLPPALPLYETLTSKLEPSLFDWPHLRAELQEGWRFVTHEPLLLAALLQACFGSLMLLTVAGLAPFFVTDLLDQPTSATALIFTPAGIGLVIGSLLVPKMVARFGPTHTMVLGMAGMTIGFVLLPAAQWLARLADPAGWPSAVWLLALVAVLTSLIGFGLDFLIVPSQACMQERSPASVRGRVLALYQALFNGGSIPVVLGLGVLTDVLGIMIVIYLLGIVSLGAAIGTILRARNTRRRQGERPEANPVPVLEEEDDGGYCRRPHGDGRDDPYTVGELAIRMAAHDGRVVRHQQDQYQQWHCHHPIDDGGVHQRGDGIDAQQVEP